MLGRVCAGVWQGRAGKHREQRQRRAPTWKRSSRSSTTFWKLSLQVGEGQKTTEKTAGVQVMLTKRGRHSSGSSGRLQGIE